MCWNCKLQWSRMPGSSWPEPIVKAADFVSPRNDQSGHLEYPFTPRELERLEYYRAAVIAGFYTDALTSHQSLAASRRKV